ncbi:LexA signal peptidase [Coniophora puteana RWD-64-598 SS2]|uniref:Mitochondrial inner membrane protease subunit n=1 Tax=Coniophora puteana (strain RWD-64-598) TaxID=741705 RepID=A0A5M3MTC7_CONPW|nr:LexA signal peptidase [Coniophora puteana RWD-64-598 SS2]EIW82413.1 LexA signal peptidase [Coniophora puteana RWD-64-598 SS2]
MFQHLLKPVSFLYWLPVGIAVNEYVYTLKTVKGRSMQPTLNPDDSFSNDVLLFDRYSIRAGKPVNRGDIVALKDPIGGSKVIVKRIIAIEGDTVQTLPPYPDAEVVLPKGHVWVEGDEPFHTLDSNKFGSVPVSLIESRLTSIIWPLHRFGLVQSQIDKPLRSTFTKHSDWYCAMAAFERERKRQDRISEACK